MSEREASDLYRVRKTLCQMLNDRGYIIGEDDLTLTLEEFKQQFSDDDNKIVREKCQITTCLNDDSTDQLFAFFPNAAEKLGKSAIEPYLQQMKQEEVKRAILVLQQQPTSFAASQIKSTDDFTIEVFIDHELMVNITHHELVPKHEVLTDDQKATLLRRYKLKETQLPRILKSDAVARYFGLKRGQVVKIIRPSETAGRYVTYRLVM
jgi:DNA-directed RNA polymerase I, II, and III subunit RPABC1